MFLVSPPDRKALSAMLKVRLWYADIVSVGTIAAAFYHQNPWRLFICFIATFWYVLGIVEWYLRLPKSS